jgi:Ca-activated chloride channel homolog
MRCHLTLAAIVSCAVTLGGQEALFHADVNLVNLGVRVTENGRDIAGLGASDFTLLEEGRPQKIAVFGSANQPLTLGILLDTSASMAGQKIREAKQALGALVASQNPDNEIWYMEFNTTVGPVVELAGAGRRLPAVSQTVAQRDSTALYDALSVTMCRLRNARHPRQALVVITDGVDQASRIHLEEVLRMVRFSPVQVFMLGYFNGPERLVFRADQATVQLISGQDVDNPLRVFDRLSRESGAEVFFPRDDADLKTAVAAVANVLRSQYNLGYYPASGGQPLRKIEVKVARSGAQVQTRPYVYLEDAVSQVFTSTACSISAQQRPFPYERKLTVRDGLVIYHDDFSDPGSGWPQNSDHADGQQASVGGVDSSNQTNSSRTIYSRASRRYTKDGYTLSREGPAPRGSLVDSVLSAAGPPWKDFRATLELTPRSIDQASGLVFRLNDVGFYAFLLYQPNHSADVFAKVVRRKLDGQSVDLAPWQQVGASGTISKHRKLTVEARGDSFRFFVDGRQVMEVHDSVIEDGLVGMAAYGEGVSKFHDLLVEELRPHPSARDNPR